MNGFYSSDIPCKIYAEPNNHIIVHFQYTSIFMRHFCHLNFKFSIPYLIEREGQCVFKTVMRFILLPAETRWSVYMYMYVQNKSILCLSKLIYILSLTRCHRSVSLKQYEIKT